MNPKEIIKKYPGTVVGVISKLDPNFEERFAQLLSLASFKANLPFHKILQEKLKTYGSAVVCESPEGFITEGNIVEILDCGATWLTSSWKASVIVEDHESHEKILWDAKYVTFIGKL